MKVMRRRLGYGSGKRDLMQWLNQKLVVQTAASLIYRRIWEENQTGHSRISERGLRRYSEHSEPNTLG